MDILGVIISILGLIQNWKQAQRCEDKNKYVISTIKELMNLDSVLLDAKRVHDCIEVFQTESGDHIDILRDQGKQSKNAISQNGVSYCKRLASLLDCLSSVELDRIIATAAAHDNATEKQVPKHVLDNVRDINYFFPRMIESLKLMKEHHSKIIRFCKEDEFFSTEFENTFSLLQSKLEDLLGDADKVILCTAYISSFIHYEMISDLH